MDAENGSGQMMPKGLGTWEVPTSFPLGLGGDPYQTNQQTNKHNSLESRTGSNLFIKMKNPLPNKSCSKIKEKPFVTLTKYFIILDPTGSKSMELFVVKNHQTANFDALQLQNVQSGLDQHLNYSACVNATLKKNVNVVCRQLILSHSQTYFISFYFLIAN